MNAKMNECTNLLVMNPIDWTLNTVVLSPLSAHDLLSQLGLTYAYKGTVLGRGGGRVADIYTVQKTISQSAELTME